MDTHATRDVTASRTASNGDGSIGDLIKELRDEGALLLRQEVALAKTEVSEKVGRILRNVGYIAAGALIAFLGIIFILQAATVGVGFGLSAAGLQEHTLWLAPLITGLVVALIGAAFASKGLATLKHESLAPDKTLNSLNQDKQWIQNKVS